MEGKLGVEINSLGVLSIATNDYLKYWFEMAKSLDLNTQEDNKVFLHLFTDQPTKARRLASVLRHCQVGIYEIPSFGWPDATLLRYRIFEREIENFTQDILMYLDADMLVSTNLVAELKQMIDMNKVSLVCHPGFWREKGLKRRTLLYIKNPKLAIADLRMKIAHGGIGSWERRKVSTAFVPRSKRKFYVCGGTWLGPNTLVKQLISSLSRQVDKDESNSVMAVWHDESHLNSWASKNEYKILSPRYCHDATYIQLKNLEPAITAVNKAIV